ncbi:MAG: rod shape-determining protein MreC [Verrucomicrobia bacterium]|jgi:rod shape-determining protein MreC|nr:rod shape-determining protein MreC [Verrucomicrobiota bacterium]
MLRLSFSTKALLLALLLFSFWWFSPLFFKRVTATVFQEFQAPAWTGLSYLRDLRSYWSLRGQDKETLIEAGADLARLNSAYSIRNQRAAAIEEENERLEAFFDLPPRRDYRYEVARVVRRDLNNWWQTLTIRKGLTAGVREGQAVVFSGGVVGRILRANAYTATVQLVSDPRFRTAAHFEGDTRPVEYRGQLHSGLGSAAGEVSTVPPDLEVELKEPLQLTSSRLGGTFPDGLTLGWVYHLEPTPDGLFQYGPVRLDPRLRQLREVAVLVPVEAANGNSAAPLQP